MKKSYIGLLLGVLTLSCACSVKPENAKSTVIVDEVVANTESTDENNLISSEKVTPTSEKQVDVLSNLFLDVATTNQDSSLNDIVTKFINSAVTPFEISSTIAEEGYLAGFSDIEINGFNEAYQIGPMIGSIPFIAYAFNVNENSVEEFKTMLLDHADLRWNVCTEADSKMCVSYGNFIFFIMSPDTFEE